MKAVPAVAVVLGLAGVARGQAMETGAIEGRIVRSATGGRVAGEVVIIDDMARYWRTTVRSDGAGRFVVSALLPGTYALELATGPDSGLVWYVDVDAGRTTHLVADLDAGKV